MRIPLFNRLKKRLHVETAMLQDEVVDIVYGVSPKAVLHGGTSIWRCYAGNRFSEDLDFYLGSGRGFEARFRKSLESRGLSLLKFKKTENSIFSRISNGIVEVRFEAAFRKPRAFEPRPFERVDGSFMNVFTLSPEGLLLEKLAAYKGRCLVRDIYDVFMLSGMVVPTKEISAEIRSFLRSPKPPVDENNLKAIVFSGAVPSFEQMLLSLKRRFKK